MSVDSSFAGHGGVLVVYYSVSGNTARVASDLAKHLHADVENLRDPQHGTGTIAYFKAIFDALRGRAAQLGKLAHDPRNYALVVVGTPVWAWKMTPAIRTYLTMYAADLKNVAFFVTSGDTDVAKIVPAVEAVIRRSPVATAGFNAAELANPAVYAAKLSEFVRTLERPAVPAGQSGPAIEPRPIDAH